MLEKGKKEVVSEAAPRRKQHNWNTKTAAGHVGSHEKLLHRPQATSPSSLLHYRILLLIIAEQTTPKLNQPPNNKSQFYCQCVCEFQTPGRYLTTRQNSAPRHNGLYTPQTHPTAAYLDTHLIHTSTRHKMGWGQRTFSFSSYSYTGVGQGHPNQPDVNSMARAAASSVAHGPEERANSGLSSAAAAAAIRRHSLTSSTSQPNMQARNGSLRGNSTGRTNSLLGGRSNSLLGGRKNSLRGQSGGFASVAGTSASGQNPDAIEEESGSVSALPNVRQKGKRGTRTYSLTTPFEGFEDGGIGSGPPSAGISPNTSLTSVASPGRTSSLRHSLRGPPSNSSLRRSSMTTNTERTHSLTSTTTTIKRMGSFHVITTKTHEVPPNNSKRAPAKTRLSQGGAKPAYQQRDLLQQQREEREARQQQANKVKAKKLREQQQRFIPVVKEPEPPQSPVHYASSVLSYESDLNTVSEYPESGLTSPDGSVGSGSAQARKHMPPPRTLSPMKPALKNAESPRNSFTGTMDNNSLSPHSSIDSPSRRKQRVSFSSESESNFIAAESQRQKALLSLPQASKPTSQQRPKQFSPGTVVPISNNQLGSNGLPKIVKTPERQTSLQAQQQAHQQALKHAKMHQKQQPRQQQQQQQQHVAKTKKAHPHPPPAIRSPLLTSESEEDLSMFQDAHEHLRGSKPDLRAPVPVSPVKRGAVEAKTEPATGHPIDPPIITTIGDVQEAQDEAAAYNELMADPEQPIEELREEKVTDSPSSSRFGTGVFGSVVGAVSGAVAAADKFGKQMQFNPSESTLESLDQEGSIYGSVHENDAVASDNVGGLRAPAQLHVNTDAAAANTTSTSDISDDLPTPKLSSSQFSGSPSSPSVRRNYRQYALGDMPVPSSSDIDAVSPSKHKFTSSVGSIGSNYNGGSGPRILDYSQDVEKPRDSVYADSNYDDNSMYETTASQFVPAAESDEEEDVPIKSFGKLKTSPRLGPSEVLEPANVKGQNASAKIIGAGTGHVSPAPIPAEFPTLDPGSPMATRQPSPPKRVGFAAEEEVVEHVPHPEGPMDDTASVESDSSWRRERHGGRGGRGVHSANGGVDDQGYRLTLRDDAGYGRDVPQEPYSMRAPTFRKAKEDLTPPPQHIPQQPQQQQFGFAAVREQGNQRASLQPQARRGSVPTTPGLQRSNSASSFDRGTRSNSMSAFRMGSMREPRTSLRPDVPPMPAMPSVLPGSAPMGSRFADSDSDDGGHGGGFVTSSPKKGRKKGMRFFSSSREEMRQPEPVSMGEPGLGKKLFSSTKTLKKQQQSDHGGYAQFTQQPVMEQPPVMLDTSGSAGGVGRQKKFGKLRRVFGLD